MSNNDLDETLSLVKSEIQKAGLSRRDALKLTGLSSASLLFANTNAEASIDSKKIQSKGKILIIGGGLGGISTAARLANSLSNPNITIIEPNPYSVSYQSANTLIGAGICEKSVALYKTKDFVPAKTILLKDKAIEFNPDNNKVTLESGKVLDYDFLVIAAGLSLDFGSIKGLEEIGEAYTLGNSEKILKTFANSGVCSVFNTDAAEQTWVQMQKFIKNAQSGKRVKGIFTHPNTQTKSPLSSKEIMFLTNSVLDKENIRDNADLSYYTNENSMSSIQLYHQEIVKHFEKKSLKWNYSHNLIGIDLDNKIAKFDKVLEDKNSDDKNFTTHQSLDVNFDFMHLTPPMKAAKEIRESKLASKEGFVPVHKETLQHVNYENVFALGDIISAPMGKTAGSIRKQYKVLADNLISLMEGNNLISKYDGYTVCPLVTDIGKVILAEYNWTKKPTPTFSMDPKYERYIWWLMKVYLLKPITMHGILSGKI